MTEQQRQEFEAELAEKLQKIRGNTSIIDDEQYEAMLVALTDWTILGSEQRHARAQAVVACEGGGDEEDCQQQKKVRSVSRVYDWVRHGFCVVELTGQEPILMKLVEDDAKTPCRSGHRSGCRR